MFTEEEIEKFSRIPKLYNFFGFLFAQCYGPTHRAYWFNLAGNNVGYTSVPFCEESLVLDVKFGSERIRNQPWYSEDWYSPTYKYDLVDIFNDRDTDQEIEFLIKVGTTPTDVVEIEGEKEFKFKMKGKQATGDKERRTMIGDLQEKQFSLKPKKAGRFFVLVEAYQSDIETKEKIFVAMVDLSVGLGMPDKEKEEPIQKKKKWWQW